MPWKADQLPGQLERQSQSPILEIEVEFLRALFGHPVFRPSPQLRGEGTGDVLRKPHHLADFAHGAAGAVADHCGADRGPVTAISLIDPLDDFLAPLMLEIHVNVGRFFALGGNKSLEEQARPYRIDAGNAEHVANGAIRCTAASLAENALRSCEADDAVHGE